MSEIEPHEVLLDKLAREREKEISERRFETPILETPLFLFLLLVLTSFLFIFGKVIFLQFFKKKDLSILAKENQFSILKIGAERGVIYDRNGEQLVFNHLSFDLYYKKREEKDWRWLKTLNEVLNLETEELKKRIENSKENEVLLAKNLELKKALFFLGQKENFPQLFLKENIIREYKEGPVFSHLIGYLGKITQEELEKEREFYDLFALIGKEGIEKSYEEVLREIPGKFQIERDTQGKKLNAKIISNPQPGKSLILYLDAKLQRKLKEEMEKKIKELGANGGAGIAVDPKTGGILAMVSLPSFDNNLFAQGISEKEWEKLEKDPKVPLLNRATSAQYLLGSTIKPFIALAALEEKIISPTETIEDQGYIKIVSKFDPNKIFYFRDWAVHGKVDMRKAIAESCNVYFYTIGGGYGPKRGLGPIKIKKYLELFGFGKIPEVDFPIPKYSSGFIGDPEWKKENLKENWWDGDTYNLSIGQGFILATPLQVAQAYLPIATKGKLLKLRFVWKIVNEKGEIIKEFGPEVIKENFISKENLEVVREGMRWAVTGENSPHASAVLLKDLPVTAAAKTGTAQVQKKGCENCYQVWISTFAPFEDPKILLVIVLEDVRGKLSQVVLPIAKEVLDWYFKNEN